jgi:hypothetical protein
MDRVTVRRQKHTEREREREQTVHTWRVSETTTRQEVIASPDPRIGFFQIDEYWNSLLCHLQYFIFSHIAKWIPHVNIPSRI